MQAREATIADTAEVLAFVRATTQFDRELGTLTGDSGTSEELICRHLFGPRPFEFALLSGGPGRASGSPCTTSGTRPSGVGQGGLARFRTDQKPLE
jgi:hypothetical protein